MLDFIRLYIVTESTHVCYDYMYSVTYMIVHVLYPTVSMDFKVSPACMYVYTEVAPVISACMYMYVLVYDLCSSCL